MCCCSCDRAGGPTVWIAPVEKLPEITVDANAEIPPIVVACRSAADQVAQSESGRTIVASLVLAGPAPAGKAAKKAPPPKKGEKDEFVSRPAFFAEHTEPV